MAASHYLHGARYKLLYGKSKSGKSSSSSKSVKSMHHGKSSKSADPSRSSSHDTLEVVNHRPPFQSSKSSKETFLTPLDDPSMMMTVVPSAMPSFLQHDTTNPPTALLATTPSYSPVASPHVHDIIDTEIMEHPSYSPTIVQHYNLFTPSSSIVDDDHLVESSFAPTTLYNDPTVASPAPSSTIQPNDTAVPSVASFLMDDSSMPPVIDGLFGPIPTTGGEDSFTTVIPTTLSNEQDTGMMDWPTLQPSSSSFSSSPSLIGTTPSPTTNNEVSFFVTVTLSSDDNTTSIIPSSTPTSIPITSTPPSSSSSSSNAPTLLKELNLLNPNTQDQQDTNNNNLFQGAASLMVILACAMVIMGTLYGLFTIMKKDEENVLDEYGAQLAGAVAFDADDIGEVVNVEEGGGGGVDSHLQLVTD
eukprot:CAMPEP_0201730242 /NCGR_PEP_ID=MMETSP0593-20130828/21502_1 /ASSEMBLY_ACC=CAM_ASM_000672 /TAXON_ID=267983 /ORGANISM="Skeletonema japonicum, Strain CCMP2506" /LENGTH=415 /DNA_ID=CAMNT_0048222737 /DNA_START=28 /DNA_END=1275 /DNA_ORIENTATION=-